jgi:hypothetical protein
MTALAGPFHVIASTDGAEPLMAVITGEAIRNARTPAISVRRNENRSPSSRRAPNANTSTVSAVNTKISGSTRTVIVIAGPFQSSGSVSSSSLPDTAA